MSETEVGSLILEAMPRISEMARSMCRSFRMAGESDDIRQEALLKMMRHGIRYSIDRATVIGFARAVIYGLLVSLYNRRARLRCSELESAGEAESEHPDPLASLIGAEAMEHCEREIELYCWHGYTLDEIGAMEGLCKSAVHARIARGRKRLMCYAEGTEYLAPKRGRKPKKA